MSLSKEVAGEKASDASKVHMCPKCNKALSTRGTLRAHCVAAHQWSLEANAPASPARLEAHKAKKQKRSQQKHDARTKVSGVKSTLGDRIESTSDDRSKRELFGPISSSSDVSISFTITDEEDVEPVDTEVKRAGSPLDRGGSKALKTISEPAQTSSVDKPHPKGKTPIVNWSLEPISVSDPRKPCTKKQLEMMKPSGSIKQHLSEKGFLKETQQDTPSTSKGIPTMIGEAVDKANPRKQRILELTKEWPNRGHLPSVRDIVAFRTTVPPDTTPAELGEMTGVKFNWDGQPTITSERYVQGVIAGYEHARRELVDEIQKYVVPGPVVPEEAQQRWGGLLQWAGALIRPPTPDQTFED